MILYLDTSALVKLYVEEVDSEKVTTWVGDAYAVATSLIAYVEARAAFARGWREGVLTGAQLRRVVSSFDEDWARYTAIAITDALVRRAGGLAQRHRLRGYDAIHLAAALEVWREGSAPAFGCFDGTLSRAAHKEGLLAPPAR